MIPTWRHEHGHILASHSIDGWRLTQDLVSEKECQCWTVPTLRMVRDGTKSMSWDAGSEAQDAWTIRRSLCNAEEC